MNDDRLISHQSFKFTFDCSLSYDINWSFISLEYTVIDGSERAYEVIDIVGNV